MSKNKFEDKAWLNDVVQVIKDPETGKVSLQITRDEDLFSEFVKRIRPGSRLQTKLKQESLDWSLENGHIDEEKHAYLSEKLAFIKYEANLPPQDS